MSVVSPRPQWSGHCDQSLSKDLMLSYPLLFPGSFQDSSATLNITHDLLLWDLDLTLGLYLGKGTDCLLSSWLSQPWLFCYFSPRREQAFFLRDFRKASSQPFPRTRKLFTSLKGRDWKTLIHIFLVSLKSIVYALSSFSSGPVYFGNWKSRNGLNPPGGMLEGLGGPRNILEGKINYSLKILSCFHSTPGCALLGNMREKSWEMVSNNWLNTPQPRRGEAEGGDAGEGPPGRLRACLLELRYTEMLQEPWAQKHSIGMRS